MKKKVMKTILLFSFLILISVCPNPISTTSHTKDEEIRSNILSYRMNSGDEPIYINHDDNFTDFLFPGTGDKNNPFIIEEFTITNSTHHLIEIVNTTKYFQIKNCDLDGISGNKYGIRLYNVSYGTVLENRIKNCNYGVYIKDYSKYNNISWNNISHSEYAGIFVSGGADYNSVVGNNIFENQLVEAGIQLESAFHNNISENNVYNTKGMGISLMASDYNIVNDNDIYNTTSYGISLDNGASNNTLIHNTVHNNTYGLDIADLSLDNNLSSNTIFDIRYEGIKVKGASDWNYIFNNTIYNCRYFGIALSSAFHNEINGNTLFNNTQDGMNLVASNYNKIWYNTIIKSWNIGIYIGPISSDNTIELNDFVTMNSGTTHASVENISNTFDLNYWDGWYSSEGGGFSRGLPFWKDPYIIRYPDVEDVHPLQSPINIHIAHLYYLTKPGNFIPHWAETLSGVVTFAWIESLGCPDKTVTYALYYSLEGSTTWTLISSGLNFSYGNEWNTSTVPNGNYNIKVVASCSGVESVEGFSEGAYTLWNEITQPDDTTDDNGNGGISPSWTFLIVVVAAVSVIVVKRFKQR